MEISSLIVPRVEVYWGPVNLTSPSKTPEFFEGTDPESLGPLVYDVRVGLEDQGQTPTGSFKWNPSGLGFELYERFLNKYIDYSIIINFYFVSGGFIPFEFYWGGQGDSYGKEMELGVKLITFMDGLINSNMFATAYADKEEKGISNKGAVSLLEKQFGVSDFNLIRYTPRAEKDSQKSKIKASYSDGSTFMDSVQNLAKNNGNFVFYNNIGKPTALVYGPYTWEAGADPATVVDAQSRYKEATPKVPDPSIRYLYAIAPGVITSFTRTSEWQPLQKSQEISSMLGRKAQLSQAASTAKTRTTADRQQSSNQGLASSPQGIHGTPNTPNIRSVENQDGPKKIEAFTRERASKLSMSTFLCPALMGIKPLDIILIRSYSKDYVEDWVVNSVEYQQTQGGVDVSIQASRTFGVGGTMVKSVVENFFKSHKLETIEDWEKYAWFLPYNKAISTPPKSGSQISIPEAKEQKVPSTPASDNPLPTTEQISDSSFRVKDKGFYDFLDKNLKSNQVEFNPSPEGGGEIRGLSQEALRAFSYRYKSESREVETQVAQTVTPTPTPTQAFEVLGPYSVKVNSPSFYTFLKNSFAGDPAYSRIFNDTAKTVGAEAAQVQYLYQVFSKRGR